MTTAHPELEGLGNYEYGWSDKSTIGDNAKRGLNEDVVRDISSKKSEPQWMLDLRLKGLSLFDKKPMPNWGSDLSGIFFDTIKYFVRSTEKQATTWDDLPDEIKNTYDRLGIPEAAQLFQWAITSSQHSTQLCGPAAHLFMFLRVYTLIFLYRLISELIPRTWVSSSAP